MSANNTHSEPATKPHNTIDSTWEALKELGERLGERRQDLQYTSNSYHIVNTSSKGDTVARISRVSEVATSNHAVTCLKAPDHIRLAQLNQHAVRQIVGHDVFEWFGAFRTKRQDPNFEYHSHTASGYGYLHNSTTFFDNHLFKPFGNFIVRKNLHYSTYILNDSLFHQETTSLHRKQEILLRRISPHQLDNYKRDPRRTWVRYQKPYSQYSHSSRRLKRSRIEWSRPFQRIILWDVTSKSQHQPFGETPLFPLDTYLLQYWKTREISVDLPTFDTS